LDHKKDAIHEHTISLSIFQKSLYRYQAEVLQLAGVGPDYATVDVAVKEVCRVISWVEDIFCHAMIGRYRFEEIYKNRGFMYQTLR
jgi:hypothetical protein